MFTPVVDRVEYGGCIMGKEERDAIMGVIDSQGGKRWTIGPESEALEKELAETVGMKRAVLTNSGSSALLVAVASLHLPKGSRVIIPALNFPTAFNAIIQNELIPYVVDIDLDTMLLDLNEVKKAVKNDTIDAVIAVNVASNPVDYQELRKIVGGGCFIICDNCDGFGTTVDGKFVDTYADISCTSFHAAHIVTMGEGGAIFTNDEELADRCRKLREWGRASGTDKLYKYPGFPEDYRERYVYEEIGYNVKPLELQCAMGRVQLKRLTSFKEKRIQNFEYLYEKLSKLPELKLVKWLFNSRVCWFSFPFMVENRKEVMEALEKNNIECRTIFSGNILRHPAYKETTYYTHSDGSMPNADKVMKDGLFISVHPSITTEMIDFIVKVIKEAVSK
jgi:CDP-6-deoxy-D-xylo-4-hexulose-3-dehydrase